MSLTVNYKGTQIAELTQDGTLTLNTAGKYCEGNISLDYSGGGAPTPPETPTDAVIFYSPNAFTLQVANRTKNWNGTLYSSTDYSTWNVWDGTTILNAAENGGYYRLFLHGVGNRNISGNVDSCRFSLSGTQIKCCGNLNNLLDYTVNPTLDHFAFAYLFSDCGNVDFNVSLPATALAERCYFGMFRRCVSLTTAPALPATVLANYCYNEMFIGCSSLTTAPELPSKYMRSYCYANMFNGCLSLTTAPALPAASLANYCYYRMFNGCISLTTIPELPTTALPNACYEQMFWNCTQIKLSTTQIDEYQTEYRIPTIGTGTTSDFSLTNMFSNTGGTFTGTPTINTTYYTSNTVIPAN